MNLLYRLKKNSLPSGATSLLLVVGIALVFVTLVAGLTTLSIRESQQATGNDLSNRALVAAQSAAKEAALVIDNNPSVALPSTCSDTSSSILPVTYELDSNNNNKTTIVCRTVQAGGATQDQTAYQDSVVTIYPSSGSPDRLNIKWGLRDELTIPAIPASCEYIEIGGRKIPIRCTEERDAVNPEPLPSDYKPYEPVKENNPAVMQVNIFSYPNNGSSGVDNGLAMKTILIAPTPTPKDYSPLNADNYSIVTSNSKCGDISSDYLCSADIDLSKVVPNNNKLIAVQFKPRYKDSSIQSQMFNSSAPNVPLNATQSTATIDVTAKVGNYYRRIQVQKPLKATQIGNSYFSDVLYSNTNICKSMTVLQDKTLDNSNYCARDF